MLLILFIIILDDLSVLSDVVGPGYYTTLARLGDVSMHGAHLGHILAFIAQFGICKKLVFFRRIIKFLNTYYFVAFQGCSSNSEYTEDFQPHQSSSLSSHKEDERFQDVPCLFG